MPSRNVVREDAADNYYHVYARGASRQAIFLDDQDHIVFLAMLKRHLSAKPAKDDKGREYYNFKDELDLLAFCLMPNHFHLMFFQRQESAISRLMQGVMSAYVGYFNNKYSRSGPLLESRYKSALVSEEPHLMHISRYIHLNPSQWQTWQWSSLPYYRGDMHADWLNTGLVLEMFFSRESYLEFVADYDDAKRALEDIKHELADH